MLSAGISESLRLILMGLAEFGFRVPYFNYIQGALAIAAGVMILMDSTLRPGSGALQAVAADRAGITAFQALKSA